MSYINIPSSRALTKKEAIELFFDRHANLLDRYNCVDIAKTEAQGICGILYQSDRGSEIALDFTDFYEKALASKKIITVTFRCKHCFCQPALNPTAKNTATAMTIDVEEGYDKDFTTVCTDCGKSQKRLYKAANKMIY